MVFPHHDLPRVLLPAIWWLVAELPRERAPPTSLYLSPRMGGGAVEAGVAPPTLT